MAEWSSWWNSLSNLNQWFYNGAAFFTVLFGWQMISAFLGLVDDGQDADVSHDGTGLGHDGAGDSGDSSHSPSHTAHEPVADFKLLTVRSVLAFFTLFFWAGGLYLTNGTATVWSLCYAVLWGLAGMLSVALVLYLLQRLVISGTPDLATCVNTRGVVYLDIPSGGTGEARVLVSGAVSCIKARAAGGLPLKAGTPVRVTRALGSTTIEVEPAAETPTPTQGAL